MANPGDVYYRLAPGVDVVAVGDGDTLLRSDTATVRIEGASAEVFRERILPLLDGTRSVAEVANETGAADAAELDDYLGQLARSHVMRRSSSPVPRAAPSRLDPLLAIVEELGVERADATRTLGAARVGVVGLEAHGAHLAVALARSGVGAVVLADPYPLEEANLCLVPPGAATSVGARRDEVVRAMVADAPGKAEAVAAERIDRDVIADLVAGCDAVAVCFDKSFSSASVWANEAGLATGTPVVYAHISGVRALVGPLVVPGQTACYMCWRMRALACEDDFEQAMSYEQFLDAERRPRLHSRSVLPFLAEYAAAATASALTKHLLGLGPTALTGRVNEFDGIELTSHLHDVLERSDCPACKKKASPGTIPGSRS
ncbi:MAG TPA: TOMM precursor leader peptide-binding protein [Actinomycetota bacterium]|nr:TOMM precursor leader peptide-binding protein [Actinomycetota bacterium]